MSVNVESVLDTIEGWDEYEILSEIERLWRKGWDVDSNTSFALCYAELRRRTLQRLREDE